MQKPIVIFDFDGVLIDSIDETALVGFNTVSNNPVPRLDELPEGYLELFRLNRCRVKHAADIVQLSSWCLNNLNSTRRLLDREESKSIFACTDEPAAKKESRFFDVRNLLVGADRAAWFNLNPPFSPIWPSLARWEEGLPLILTTKNRQAVLDLCAHNSFPIQTSQIFSGDGNTNKQKNLVSITEQYPRSNYWFVDDFPDNLFDVAAMAAELGVSITPLLASWGYNSPEDIEAAEQKGIQVVDQQAVIKLLNRIGG